MLDDIFSPIAAFNDAAFLIRAQVREPNGAYVETSFSSAAIERLSPIDIHSSVMVLGSGTRIDVDMPFEQLEKTIYFRDLRGDSFLDLRPLTGTGMEGKYDLELKFWACEWSEYGSSRYCLTLNDKNILWDSVRELEGSNSEDGMSGTLLPLVKPLANRWRSAVVHIPKAELLKAYHEAQAQHVRELDLTEWPVIRKFHRMKP